MYIEKPKELFKPCIIKPLGDQEGLITSIKYDICGIELLVRYFMHGTVLHNWFYDFELEPLQRINHNKDFFKEY